MHTNSIGQAGPQVATPAVPYTPDVVRPDRSILQLTCLLLRRRRLVAASTLGLGGLAVAITLLLPRDYTTTVSFTPVASSDASGGLAGIAGQLGVSLPTADPAQSPDFYATLIQTPDILRQVAEKKYTVIDGADTLRGTFMQLVGIDEENPSKALAAGLQTLQSGTLGIGFDRQTGIVTIDVHTQWPSLSYQIATDILQLVNEFNLGSRQLQGEQERRFLSQRLDTARIELQSAENRLEGFVARNRAYQGDPSLLLEHDRLQREVNLRQDVYNLLVQSVEQARLRSVRNTPSISLVQHPMVPLRPDRRHTVVKLLGGMVGGFVLALVWVLFRELLSKGRSSTPSDFETLERLWADSVGDVRRLFFLRRRSRAA